MCPGQLQEVYSKPWDRIGKLERARARRANFPPGAHIFRKATCCFIVKLKVGEGMPGMNGAVCFQIASVVLQIFCRFWTQVKRWLLGMRHYWRAEFVSRHQPGDQPARPSFFGTSGLSQ